MTATKLSVADLTLIAPCGINCSVCRAHQRERNPCPGCRAPDASKPKTRVICKIKTCQTLRQRTLEFCSACEQFPCAPVLHLDKRYRTKYAASPVENLLTIKKIGLEKFVRKEARKWACPRCGETLCMHDPECPSCGYRWHR